MVSHQTPACHPFRQSGWCESRRPPIHDGGMREVVLGTLPFAEAGAWPMTCAGRSVDRRSARMCQRSWSSSHRGTSCHALARLVEEASVPGIPLEVDRDLAARASAHTRRLLRLADRRVWRHAPAVTSRCGSDAETRRNGVGRSLGRMGTRKGPGCVDCDSVSYPAVDDESCRVCASTRGVELVV